MRYIAKKYCGEKKTAERHVRKPNISLWIIHVKRPSLIRRPARCVPLEFRDTVNRRKLVMELSYGEDRMIVAGVVLS